MLSILSSIGTFVLSTIGQHVLDDAIDRSTGKLQEKFLEQSDEQVREFLRNHVEESDYEALDSYAGEKGLYTSDDLISTIPGIEAEIDSLIDNFFKKNPSLSYNRQSLEPYLQQIIEHAYNTALRSMTPEGRILLKGGARNTERILESVNKAHVEDKAANANVMAELKKIRETLENKSNNSISDLPDDIVRNIYLYLFDEIDKAEVKGLSRVIGYLYNNEKHKAYWCSLKLVIAYFDGKNPDVKIAEEFCDAGVDQEVLNKTINFLCSIVDVDTLKLLLTWITDADTKDIISKLIDGKYEEIIETTTTDKNSIKESYLDNECVLWIAAFAASQLHEISLRYHILSRIQDIHSSFILDFDYLWLRASTQGILLAESDFRISKEPYKATVKKLWSLYSKVELVCGKHKDPLIGMLLQSTIYLPEDDFKTYWVKLSEEEKNKPELKKLWYYVRIIGLYKNRFEDEAVLKEFCGLNDFQDIWVLYLISIAELDPEYVVGELSNTAIKTTPQSTYARAIAECTKFDAAEAIKKASLVEMEGTEAICVRDIYCARLAVAKNLSDKESYIQTAIDSIETWTKDAKTGAYSLNLLINFSKFLTDAGRIDDAIVMLSEYQPKNPVIERIYTELLIRKIDHKDPQDEQMKACHAHIENLKFYFPNDGSLLYAEGYLEELTSPGMGQAYFEESYSIDHSISNAEHALVSRLNRNVLIDDDELFHYAAGSLSINAQYYCALILGRKGKIELAKQHFLQALILCNDSYYQDIFNSFFQSMVVLPDKEIPESIEPGTAVILRKIEDEDVQVGSSETGARRIWIHDENIIIPDKGSTFAGYEHISPSSAIANLLIGNETDDTVDLDGNQYQVITINNGTTIAEKYCLEQLVKNGGVQQFSIDPNDMNSFFETIRKAQEPHSNHVKDILKQYEDSSPGLPFNLIAYGIGKNYFDTVWSICSDPNIHLISGYENSEINGECILSVSTLAVFAILQIDPPEEDCNFNFYITPSTKRLIDLSLRQHRGEKNVVGSMIFDSNNKPIMIEQTKESKKVVSSFYTRMLKWCEAANITEDINPSEYPVDMEKVVAAIGYPDMDAMIIAQRHGYVISSDDILVRRLYDFMKVGSCSAISLLSHLGITVERMIDILEKFIAIKYMYPFNKNIIKWLSDNIVSIIDQDEGTRVSLRLYDFIKKAMQDEDVKNSLFRAMNEFLQERGSISKVLWNAVGLALIKQEIMVTEPTTDDKK
jgi:hypothetical protein